MRGGYLHNKILLDPLDRAFQGVGALVRREMMVRLDSRIAYVDLFAELSGRKFAVEAELSVHRIESDLKKGMALNADELWIVVPHRRAARCVERGFAAMTVRCNQDGLFVLTLSQALERVKGIVCD